MKTWVFNCSVIVLLILLTSFPSGDSVLCAEEIPIEFVVNIFEDGKDDDLQDSICYSSITPIQGFCTLRAAIQEASVAVENKNVIINVPLGTYNLSIPKGETTLDSDSGDLNLDDRTGPSRFSITIRGTGSQPSVIDANGIDRVLHVGAYQKVTLKNLVITGGLLVYENYGSMGGGIKTESASELTLDHVIVSENEVICPPGATDCYPSGGGIGTENSYLFMTHSRVTGNKANNGSAVYTWDGFGSSPVYTTTIINSLIDNNVSSGTSTLNTYTILRVINTTIVNNTGLPDSSNIFAQGPLWLQNSTLIYQYNGYNIFAPFNPAVPRYVRNSILINLTNSAGINWGNCGTYEEPHSPIVSEGGNVFSDDTCGLNSPLWDLVLPPGVITDPSQALLGPLQDNGGTVPTMQPLTGSQAIDRRPGACMVNFVEVGQPATEKPLLVDARDSPRDDGVCDAGAIEQPKPFKGYLPVILR